MAIWASPYAAQAGDTLTVYLRSVEAPLKVEVYRLGWYGGVGGRLVAQVTVPLATGQYPCNPPFPGPVACNWTPSFRIPLGSDWTGGLYLLRAQAPNGWSTSYPFVIRSHRPHAFVAVIPQFTWQAYNKWGGSSLYTTDPSTGVYVPVVSFARPYSGDASLAGVGGTPDAGTIQWIERLGLDVGYVSDLDLADPSRPGVEPGKAMIFIGHDEYWTQFEFQNVFDLRDSGHHLAFLSADNAYWAVRLAQGQGTGQQGERMFCYKSAILSDPGATSPAQVTGRFRDPPISRPENGLDGIMYNGLLPAGSSPTYVVAADSLQGVESRSFIATSGLTPGDTIGVLAGAEGDEIVANGFTPPLLQVLFTADQAVSSTQHRKFHGTFFVAPSGAGVFDAGTKLWAHYLSGPAALPAVERTTAAVLAWMQSH